MTLTQPTQKTMTIHHAGQQRYTAHNAAGQQIVIDMTPEHPLGVGPMDAVFAALAACSMSDVVEILRKRRTPAQKYRVELTGFRDGEHQPPRYFRYLLRHVVSGEGITREDVEKAAHLSHEKYCTVGASLNAEVDIEVVLEEG